MKHTTELSRCAPAADLTKSTTNANPTTVRPAYEARDTGDAYTVEVHLPGVTKDNVSLTFEDATLSVKASRERNPDTWQTLYRESSRGDYGLNLSFETDLDADNLQASLTDGVLTVILPKATAAQRRTITIN